MTTTPGRTWAVTGTVAGLAGIAGIQTSATIDAVYDEAYVGDAARITERLDDFVPELLVLHGTMMTASLLLLVFAAGLRRRLQGQSPAGSLAPDVAAGGLLLTSVAALMGVAFTTEIVFGLTSDDLPLDPEFGAVVAHWTGTVPWLWVGAGVTGLAVAVAALRHAAAPRWIGWAAALLGGVTTLAGVSPLQYLAGFTGPVLVLVLGAGFALGDRPGRS
ncbi:hypothetical protein [Nocardioides lianchengensis]|uniref:DUF4386 family protein n=1 Tax=Nocardioides lianchengensis TaxID=1045774 RepID=A0A1G6NQC8_9ACTN|nr:hypothetical protein [Nocardioides lianchengensis]NYG10848.1 hypothetical protein [Nocardioides lianchengensis]SDC69881.1 hypothetical protein SAMN05421872_103333 [Nocardioides lianchengensis]